MKRQDESTEGKPPGDVQEIGRYLNDYTEMKQARDRDMQGWDGVKKAFEQFHAVLSDAISNIETAKLQYWNYHIGRAWRDLELAVERYDEIMKEVI